MVYKQSEVLEHVKNYYENLYTCVDSNLVNVDLRNILYINTPKLDKQLATGLERDITEAEVLTVVKQMKNNKSPGSDEHTAEFYKFVLKYIKHFVVRAINCIFENTA